MKESTQFTAAVCEADVYDPKGPVMDNLFAQYERVIVQSLITSFGLDFMIKDQHGGDVDTIHNVRQIGIDKDMHYKNADNQNAYEAEPQYTEAIKAQYHKHENYININREASIDKDHGTLTDAYTGEVFPRNAKTHLDHVISAKEVHDDRGRILAGLDGPDLACSPENLKITNPRTNTSKQQMPMKKFLAGDPDKVKGETKYSEEDKKRMLEADRASRRSYEHKLFVAYYTSPKFVKDTAIAAGKAGVKMGMRQAIGLAFTEIWFAVKEKLAKTRDGCSVKEIFESIVEGIKLGIVRVKEKFGDLFKKFGEGVIAGALSSISTTLCNIFFTTAKNVVNIIRQTWASLVEAMRILFFNPDRYLLGDRIRAACKVLAVGASVVAGKLIEEVLSKTPFAALPVIGDIHISFIATLTTGIMTCTLLYALDRSELVQGIVAILNKFKTMDGFVNYFTREAEKFEAFAAELQKIDIDLFRRETDAMRCVLMEIEDASDADEMNSILLRAYQKLDLKLPWMGDFDSFMGNRSNRLTFA